MGFCQYCGHQTTEDENFCGFCGSLLTKSAPAAETLEMPKIVVCSNCGEVAQPGAKFCAQCGGPVSEELLENVAKKPLPTWAKVLIALCVVVVLAGVGAAAMFAVTGGQVESGQASVEAAADGGADADADVQGGEGVTGGTADDADSDAAEGEGTDGADGEDAENDDAITEEPFEVDPSEYILPESDTRLYSADELAGLTADELFKARNEIYARHGRIFSNTYLQTYFESKSWYTPVYSPSQFSVVEGLLNEYEVANINKIATREQALGTLS
jgi:ribosomal protein L32